MAADLPHVLATQQLTDFLAVVADRPEGPAAHQAAVECAARALDADVATLLIDGDVAASCGCSDCPGDQRFTARADFSSGSGSGALVLGRHDKPFTAGEITLLRGMAGVLDLSLRSLRTVESERRYAEEANERLAEYMKRGEVLFEELGGIQRAIARRVPLAQLLDMIAASVRRSLAVDMVTINMVEPDDRTKGSTIAGNGVPLGVMENLKRLTLGAAGASGLAILGNEPVLIEDYTASPIALPNLAATRLQSVMSVPVHEGGVAVGSLTVGMFDGPREWSKGSVEVVTAYADHVSLALTDARTLEEMNLAFHDSLTGLASRALFLTRMEETLPAGAAVLFVDLDRFKVVNDSLGHAAGDQLLTGVADRIRECLRPEDTAARLGGDEFAVLLPGMTDVEEITPTAARILEVLRRPFDLNGSEAYVSCSIGIAVSHPGEHDAKELMVHADLAMYQAKKQGKDRFEVFQPSMQEAFQATIAMEADLRRAVVRHEFELRYQPIVQLNTGEITGVEALIRWQHPTRGVIPPMDFIPLAEETGMIVPIGEWVLREAVQRVAAWNRRRSGRPLTVSVNISAVQLEQFALPQVVRSALENSGLPADRLVLELTESLLVDHRQATLDQLEAIKALGVRLAIDDFGTGYSSLAYLRRFPVDIIKIDKSLVDDVGDEPTAAALTLGIIQLGRALQLSTIAEGIEHESQLDSLAGGDCELGQGYYFAEPLTHTALDDLLFPLYVPPADPR